MFYVQLSKQKVFFQSKSKIRFRAESCQNQLNISVSLKWHFPAENCFTSNPLAASGLEAELE